MAFIRIVADATSATAVTAYPVENAAAAGNTIIVAVTTGTSTNLTSITDSAGNTYSVDRKTTASTRNVAIAHAYLDAALTTSDTITVTISGTAASAMVAIEHSNIRKTSPVDKVNSAAGTSVTTLATGTTGTLADADELVVTAIGINLGSGGFTAPTGYAEHLPAGVSGILDIADLLVTATTAQNPSWSWVNSATGNAAVVTYIVDKVVSQSETVTVTESKSVTQLGVGTLIQTASGTANNARQRQDGAGFDQVGITASSNTAVGSRYSSGIRFTNIDIPKNAKILTAVLNLTVATTKTDDANFKLYCEAVDDAVDFTTNADVYQRALTTAFSSLVQDSLGAVPVDLPDFASAVQEVINRSGWTKSNDLMTLLIGNSDINKSLEFQEIDSAAVWNPYITITWVLVANPSESITVSESISVVLTSFIIQSDSITVTEAVTARVESFINVSDSVTVTENVSILIPTLLVSVSDSVAVTESVNTLVTSFINKTDTITVTENVVVAAISTITVSDSVIVTESVTTQVLSFVTVSETITVSENVSVLIPELLVTVSDNVTVTEALQLQELSFVNKAETVTVSESVTVQAVSFVTTSDTVTVTESVQTILVYLIAVNDSVTVSESTNAVVESYINVSESVIITESVSVAVEAVDAYSVNVSDSVTVSESVEAMVTSFVNKSDSITVTEATTFSVRFGNYYIERFPGSGDLSDSSADLDWIKVINGANFVQLSGVGNVNSVGAVQWYGADHSAETDNNETEATIVTFTRTSGSTAVDFIVRSPTPVTATTSTADGYSVSIQYANSSQATVRIRRYADNAATEILASIDITLSLPETWKVQANGSVITVFRNGTEFASVIDTGITTGKYGALRGFKNSGVLTVDNWSFGDTQEFVVSESESITVSESVSLLVPLLHISVSDQITVTETVNTEVISFVNTSEAITVTESLALATTSLIAVSETVNVTESVKLEVVSFVNVNDSITVNESVVILITSFVNVTDSITVSENVSVVVEAFGATDITVSETITVSELVVVSVGTNIHVVDNVTVTETLAVLVTSFVNVSDLVTVTESVTVVSAVNISVTDTVTISEATTQLVTSFIQVSEPITVVENVSLFVPMLPISVSDTITVSESVAVLLQSFVNVSDTVTATESVNTSLLNLIAVNDQITITESIKLQLISLISATETVTVTELVSVVPVQLVITASDLITVTEQVLIALLSQVPGDLDSPTHTTSRDSPTESDDRGSDTQTGSQGPTVTESRGFPVVSTGEGPTKSRRRLT